jgi:hypothetical protein
MQHTIENIIGFILSVSVKSVNLKSGINLNLSCGEQVYRDRCGYDWLRQAGSRRLCREQFRQGLKR